MVVTAMPRPHSLQEILGTHCIGGLVSPRVGAENLAPTGILSPDLPTRREMLYRLSYPDPPYEGA